MRLMDCEHYLDTNILFLFVIRRYAILDSLTMQH